MYSFHAGADSRGGQVAGDQAHQFRDFGRAFEVDLVGGVGRAVVILVVAGEGVEDRHAARVKAGGIRRSVTVALQRERQTDRHVAFFDLRFPPVGRPEPLKDERFVEPADHVHVEAGGEHAVEFGAFLALRFVWRGI